ncbi:MAG: LLM class flavin-dependent oxidoreductase [Gammaproteobacteria bacterium]|nr:LLM class flavin-dependent oxidoreductase [Gammaproteobacteria bacterium]MDP7094292.1 LLM class flavin-dependent oxidoreductase [Gammaproteobacteria bacterium]MDP7420005.1 LLM class flavin-dependent oxidoreductase [Gammaproteobacteria bacterium]HJP40052.1 LLM class flavin-dependent oxidoreductase [Gammaproteobacteria bacterium]
MNDRSLSIAFQTDKPLSEYGELARSAETWGFDTISVYNDMLYQPAWLPLLEVARSTSRARIGVAAVNPFTCHPINIAGHIALIDEASGGRTYLGLARGGWLDFIGVHPQQPVQALREAFACIRHLLSGNTAPLEQELYPLAGGDTLRWKITCANLPLLLGSWGLKTIQACHSMVNEIKLGGSANPAIVPHYRLQLDTMGNTRDLGIVMGAVTVIDEDGQAARALAKQEMALYLPVVAKLDQTLQIEPGILQGVTAAVAAYDFASAGRFISDELLAAFALAGTPEDIITQTEALFAAGASRVEFGTPHGLSAASGLRLLGEKVLPAFKR